jgi:hypothetical protein
LGVIRFGATVQALVQSSSRDDCIQADQCGGHEAMRRERWWAGFALAAGLLALLAASAANADECDDVITAIKQRIDGLRATRKSDDSRTTICARLGRVSGLTQAIGIVGAECLDEGARRNALIKDTQETEKALEVDNVCR